MCGRFTLAVPSAEELASLLGLDPDSAKVLEGYRPRYNIAPTDPCFVLVSLKGKRKLVNSSWGLPKPDGSGRVINARAETVRHKKLFREAFETGRCVVPADGFYEWRAAEKPGPKHPYWVHPATCRLFYLAAICEPMSAEPGAPTLFTILTVPAGPRLAPIHDRMPLVLGTGAVDTWLSEETPDDGVLLTLSQSAQKEGIALRPVSTRVNRVAVDDPECLREAPGALGESPARQLNLFGPRKAAF